MSSEREVKDEAFRKELGFGFANGRERRNVYPR